jgi:uncharacterized protein involved in oxidation of intracellular sulfur
MVDVEMVLSIERSNSMNLGIIISSNDPESVWNAFRLANFALKEGDIVKIFLIGKGVEADCLDTDKFEVTGEMNHFVDKGGGIFACSSCLKLRGSGGSEICPMSTMKNLYEIV